MAKDKTGSIKSGENVSDDFRVIVIGPQVTELLHADSGLGERAEVILKCADLEILKSSSLEKFQPSILDILTS